MQTPKLLWIKNKLPKVWSKAANFFDLSDFLTWKATGGSKVRSLCSTVCKWTFEGLLKTWNETYFRQIGLGDLADENFERIGSDILRLVPFFTTYSQTALFFLKIWANPGLFCLFFTVNLFTTLIYKMGIQ